MFVQIELVVFDLFNFNKFAQVFWLAKWKPHSKIIKIHCLVKNTVLPLAAKSLIKMLIFVLWPKMNIEKKLDAFRHVCIIHSTVCSKQVSRNPGIKHYYLWFSGICDVELCLLMSGAGPHSTNARFDGDLASYGRGSGRGSKNTELPQERCYPANLYWQFGK